MQIDYQSSIRNPVLLGLNDTKKVGRTCQKKNEMELTSTRDTPEVMRSVHIKRAIEELKPLVGHWNPRKHT